ncbi:sugar ABC transporter ATP-binding protein [Jiangella alkaliphila]|uniref:Monosaccharide ABC transporter ATP-binding protein, CUT2 family n=1 Tax=Jiangella alkaliphila TaxID=419479 RepID=A0A1H2LDZ0_9ACTN|nr:sugar ABC transporter ATP-binding protein [Jiangella alkaliphila]SDU79024.1 monosaccharide ABC transporter ATP-binding protein, CUT2 family [Jiangella alkaliphila]
MHGAATPGPRLRVEGATKRYPGVVALDGVELEVQAGEVHALVGENGAGKSTLVRILGGVHPADDGSLLLDGEPYAPQSPQDALSAGIRVVHQELATLPNLTVAENLFLDQMPRRAGVVRYGELNAAARRVLETVALDVAPQTRMERLSLAQKQLVEIARALATEARLVIFDEPTATLTIPEKRRLLSIIRDLRAGGVAVIYISHHLDEVFEVCDRATVLRNGRSVGTRRIDELSTELLVRMMVGKELADDHPFPDDVAPGPIVLEVDGLTAPAVAHDVSFTVREGEIVGLAGLVGAGRTEAVRTIFGADRARAGTVRVRGRVVPARHPRGAVRAGISLAPEDRKEQGLVLEMGCDVNISLASLPKVSRYGLLRRRDERRETAEAARRMNVKVGDIGTPAGTLSGGNQQKVVLGRWLYRESDVLIVDEPTRGIDVGARHEIYRLLADLARAGKAIVIVSSDLNELMGMSHRILVFSRGRIAADVDRVDFDQERILAAAYSAYLTEKAEKEAHVVD